MNIGYILWNIKSLWILVLYCTCMLLANYSIPPNTVIGIFPYIVHRNEEIFSNPEEFAPERFLDETNKDAFLFGYLPFSAGPRNCIGKVSR